MPLAAPEAAKSYHRAMLALGSLALGYVVIQEDAGSAAGRGLPTEIRVVGDPGRPTREVAGATLAAVDGVMRALPPHAVTLTVLASSDEVELYVIFDQRPA
jgi:hypothetical protein